jgi:hypothetical protein
VVGVGVGVAVDRVGGFPEIQPDGVTSDDPVMGLLKLRVIVWGATLSQ